MKNLSKISFDESSKNQVLRSSLAKTQQPDADFCMLKSIF